MKLAASFILAFLFVTIAFPGRVEAQFKSFHASAYLGYGAIKGNSPAQESLFMSLSLGTGHEIIGDVELRLGYLYARKITYFLPEDRTGRYYPYIHSLSLKGFIRQPLSSNFFIEEGIGFVMINDRVFDEVDVWDAGMGVTAFWGADLRDESLSGFKLSLGAEFAITFTNTNASYYTIMFQPSYYF